MNTINSRIKLIIDRVANGNNSKFAKMVGTSDTNIRNYTLDVEPKANFLLILATKFNINIAWVLAGGPESEMFLSKSEIHANKSVDYSKEDPNYEKKYIAVLEQLVETQKEIQRLKDELGRK